MNLRIVNEKKKALKKKRKTYEDFSNPTNKVLSFVDQGAKFQD